jgi:hypothetical protein
MTTRVSLVNQSDATAREQDFQELVALQRPVAAASSAPPLPVDGWEVADPHYNYHRYYFNADPAVNVPHSVTWKGLVLSGLFVVLVAVLEEGVWDEHCDADLLDFLCVEVLWRTQADMRASNLEDMMSDKFKGVRETVWRTDSGPGIHLIQTMHTGIKQLADWKYVHNAAQLFNFLFSTVVSLGNHVVLDEIVINYTSKIHYQSHKKNASGPEMLVAAMPVRGTGSSALFWLKPRLWAAQCGPSMAQIVEECHFTLISQGRTTAPQQQPVLALDSRFLSKDALNWLRVNMVPFVGTLNSAWYAELHSYITGDAKQILKGVLPAYNNGCVVYERGSVMLYKASTHSSSTATTAPATTTAANKASESATAAFQFAAGARPKRKQVRSSRLRDFDTTEDNTIVDDGGEDDVSPKDKRKKTARGGESNEPYLNLEWYQGVGDSKRREPQLLVSNAIAKERREHGREEDPVAPLARLFDATWRRVDQANKEIKEQIMLHGDTMHHHMDEKMLWFDVLLSTALHTSFVLSARKLDQRILGENSNYTLQEYGLAVAKLCAELRATYGARRHSDKTVRTRFLRGKVGLDTFFSATGILAIGSYSERQGDIGHPSVGYAGKKMKIVPVGRPGRERFFFSRFRFSPLRRCVTFNTAYQRNIVVI